MFKRRRPIVLDKEVGDPRQRIRKKERQDDPPPMPQDHGSNQQRPSRQRPREMKCPCARLLVRAYILGPEICEIRLHVHHPENRQIQRKLKAENRDPRAGTKAKNCQPGTKKLLQTVNQELTTPYGSQECLCRERESPRREAGANRNPARSLRAQRSFPEDSSS
jgi:hypothetical protein